MTLPRDSQWRSNCGGQEFPGRQNRPRFGLRGKGVEGGRRSPEEVALGVAEIGAVLQGPDLDNKGRQGVAGTGRLIVGKPALAGGLLDSQLGALLVAEEFVGLSGTRRGRPRWRRRGPARDGRRRQSKWSPR